MVAEKLHTIHAGPCDGCALDRPTIVEGYCQQCRENVVYLGFTRAELHQAFARVQPADNWKHPIKAVLIPMPSEQEIKAIDAAITFYCGGGAKFRVVERAAGAYNRKALRVTAPGYYAVIGA